MTNDEYKPTTDPVQRLARKRTYCYYQVESGLIKSNPRTDGGHGRGNGRERDTRKYAPKQIPQRDRDTSPTTPSTRPGREHVQARNERGVSGYNPGQRRKKEIQNSKTDRNELLVNIGKHSFTRANE